MSSRKSDPSARRSDSSAALSSARLGLMGPSPPVPPPTAIPAPAPAPSPSPSPSPSPGLAKPSMDTSMPPPSLPPPAPAQAAVHHPPSRPTPSPAAPAPAPDLPRPTPSEKTKDDEKKTGGGGHPKEAITIPIEELQLPKSIITRLAKGVLPPNTQIQANAILAMTKSATVFINHLANAANEVTTLQNKKTVMPADVFRALDDIEFGFMRERVEAEFAKFNEVQTSKRSTYRKKVAAAKKATKGPGDDGAEPSTGAGADVEDTTMGGADTTLNSAADSSVAGAGGQPRAKKARTEGGAADKMDVDDEAAHASNPESVADEDDDEDEVEDGDDDDDDDEEEEEAEAEAEAEDEDEDEEDEDEDEAEEGGGDDADELEERQSRPDEDEALDDGNNSD